MKIVYFHGFGSSHASGTVELLRNLLPEDEIVAPDIPIDPVDALPYLKEYVATEQPDVIIGTSMGGMYAQMMRGYKRILVNPAFNMSTMSKGLKAGEHRFYNGRYDGAKTFKITRDIIQHHNQMERQQFKDITAEDKELVWGLFGINDPIVKTLDVFKKHYLADHVIRFEGEHQLNDKVIKKVVLPLLEQLKPQGE